MADKKGRPTVAQWEDHIRQAEVYRDDFCGGKRWGLYYDYYRGEFPGYGVLAEDDILPYNITFRNAKATVPKVYYRNPYISVTPRVGSAAPELAIQSKVNEAVANYMMDELNIKKTMKMGVLDCFFTNRAIFKVGYDSLYGYRPSQTWMDLGRESEEGEQDSGQFSKKGERTEWNAHVKEGMPWVVRRDPSMWAVPFGVRAFEECGWVDDSFLRPTLDVKNSRIYDKAVVGKLEGSHVGRLMENSRKSVLLQGMGKHIDLTEIHEVMDAKAGRIYAFILHGSKGYIRDDENELQVDGLPYVTATFNEDPERFWGPSDARIIEPQQLEMNEARTQAMYHRRIALIKFLYDINKIDKETMDNALEGLVGPGLPCDGDPSTAIMELTPNIPPDLINWVRVIDSDSQDIIGLGKQDMGSESTTRKTKYESSVIHEAHMERMNEKRDTFGDALEQVIRKVMQITYKFWKQPKVAQVVGFDGAKYWVSYTAKDIAGEFKFKVDVESMAPSTKSMKRKELTQLIQALAANPRANLDYLMRMLMREFDYLDALQVLPEAPEMAGGQPMPYDQFQGQQQKMLQNPGELRGRTQKTAAALSGMQF